MDPGLQLLAPKVNYTTNKNLLSELSEISYSLNAHERVTLRNTEISSGQKFDNKQL